MVNKSYFNTKTTEAEILNISGLATKPGQTTVKNKIPSVSNLVKKSKITEVEKKLTDHNHDKCFTTRKFNTLAAGVFDARLAQENLVTKT